METRRFPPEIWSQILQYLDYPGAKALQMTNWDFHEFLAAPEAAHGHKSFTIDDLLQIETWPEYDHAGQPTTPLEAKQACAGLDYFACSVCLRIRDASKFTNAMMKGSRRKVRGEGQDHRGSFRRRTRFCIECGVRGHRFTETGTLIRFGGRQLGMEDSGYGAICPGCRQFFVLKEFTLDRSQNVCERCVRSSQRISGNI